MGQKEFCDVWEIGVGDLAKKEYPNKIEIFFLSILKMPICNINTQYRIKENSFFWALCCIVYINVTQEREDV